MEVKTWVNYTDFNFEDASCDEEVINAVCQNIAENAYKFGGNDHENHSFCCPLLSNGKALRVSWRKWGEIMARAYNLKTDNGDWNYSLWYMGEYGTKERKFPTHNKIDISDFPIIRDITYEASLEEYKNITNPFLYGLAISKELFDQLEIRSFCKIIFKYKGSILLEAVVNDSNFLYCSLDSSDEVFEDTNVAGFDKEKLQKLITKDIVIVYFNIINDYRSEYNLN